MQEVFTEIGNGTLSHIRKSIDQIKSIGPESQVEKLKQHVVDIAINLYKMDLFEQLGNSINITLKLETGHKISR